MSLFDQWGRPLTSKRPEGREIAVASVRDRWASYPSQGLTPGRLAAIFKEADQGDVYRQAELFEEMEEKDAHLLSVLQTRRLAVAGLEWEVTSASDSPEDKDIAEDCRELLSGMDDFDDRLVDLLDAVGKGFSAVEIMWETGSRFVPSLKEQTHQRRFTFMNPDITGGVLAYPRLLTDEAPAYGIPLPSYKFMLHVYKAKAGNVPRGALLRPCAWMYLFKNYDIKDWITFCEVFGMPLRLGKYEPSTSKEDKESLIQAVTQLGTDAAGIISSSTQIEFIETAKGTQGADIFKLFLDFTEAEMSKAVLGQTLTSSSGEGKGSYALGKVHNEVRGDIKKADAKALSKTVRRDLLAPYVFYNYGFDKKVPNFKLIAEDPKDLLTQIKIDREAQKMGQKITARYMRDTYGYAEAGKDDEVLVPLPSSPSPSGRGGQGGEGEPDGKDGLDKAKLRLALKAANAEPDAVDALAARLMGEADLDGMMAPVARIVAEAESMEDLRDRLLDVYRDMDAAELGALLQRALAVAELAGRFEAL